MIKTYEQYNNNYREYDFSDIYNNFYDKYYLEVIDLELGNNSDNSVNNFILPSKPPHSGK